MKLIWIGGLGIAGVVARYSLGVLTAKFFPSAFPVATFTINLLGAFLIGVVFVLGDERALLSPELRLGLMVGFLGGFTTFSAYCLEVFRLVEQGRYLLAAAYFSLSPILGYGFAALGFWVARR